MKTCARCQTTRPLDEFPARLARGKRYWARTCKPCRRKGNRFPTSPKGYHFCSACQEHKPVNEFGYRLNSKRETILKRQCRTCRHERESYMVRYRKLAGKGITPDDYDAMLQDQGGVCAICENPEKAVDPRTGLTYRLSIDHDHSCCPGANSCGACIRGLLCQGCNQGIGQLRDDPDRVEKAAAYLRERNLPRG